MFDPCITHQKSMTYGAFGRRKSLGYGKLQRRRGSAAASQRAGQTSRARAVGFELLFPAGSNVREIGEDVIHHRGRTARPNDSGELQLAREEQVIGDPLSPQEVMVWRIDLVARWSRSGEPRRPAREHRQPRNSRIDDGCA